MNHEALVLHYSEGEGAGCGVRRVRFCAQLTGESYYSTSWYMYSVLKKVLEYRYPLYRSTGTRFKKLFLSIVFTILKKSYFWNIQPVHLGFFKNFSKNAVIFLGFCGPLPPATHVSQTKQKTWQPSEIFLSPTALRGGGEAYILVYACVHNTIWRY